jgi:glycosyltransferase involved in cell wall biosynthesis
MTKKTKHKILNKTHLHVLYYHLYFNTRNDTSGTRSYEMARRLIATGHKVTIVCGSREGKLHFDGRIEGGYKYGTIDGIDVIEVQIPPYNYDNFIQRAFTFVRFGLRGIKLAFKLEYDLLFATSTPLTVSIPGVVMKYFRNKPFVFEVRDLWPELPKAMGVIRNPIALWTMSFLELISYRKADACIGLSPGIVDGIRRRSRKSLPVTMIPNGCDIDVFKPGKREEIKLEGLRENDLIAVFTGAHGIANGLNAVLDAASYLKRIGRDDIKLLFIGSGTRKVSLMERGRKEQLDNCMFLDPVPKNKLNEITGSADVGLMILANIPAFYYGTSPNKYFDYLASGLPILNNYPGWLADMIREHSCGVVVEPDDPEAFGEALIFLADHPQERKKMGANARRLAEREFKRDMLASEFVAWLEAAYSRYHYSNFAMENSVPYEEYLKEKE